ncbi:hypothetical protein, partial [Herbaspirillum aquaticum]|uniref:hypothetical protein n=1 Tax=Herbaspirillum aquaticum TaxID=568783 RepID=UPI0024DECBE2
WLACGIDLLIVPTPVLCLDFLFSFSLFFVFVFCLNNFRPFVLSSRAATYRRLKNAKAKPKASRRCRDAEGEPSRPSASAPPLQRPIKRIRKITGAKRLYFSRFIGL